MASLKFFPYRQVLSQSAQAPRPMVLLLRPQRMPEQQLRELLTRNPQHATRWIATAARAGLPAAQVVWAQLLLEGRGVERDPAGAFTWFAKAAAAGDIEACNMLGRCYERVGAYQQTLSLPLTPSKSLRWRATPGGG
ncbi:tetratricopeptide repeat protein [Pseudomonas typographi]|uniref:tetratricopeptide repeat protein n=1 Tax=Pseudomonas typographi TaxID=2715964 RepID=UPI0019343288|nr:SEL1-like repeat protein [Pseudomonas typographi]